MNVKEYEVKIVFEAFQDGKMGISHQLEGSVPALFTGLYLLGEILGEKTGRTAEQVFVELLITAKTMQDTPAVTGMEQ